MSKSREPGGIPTGGRWATESKSESNVELAADVSDDKIEFARETLGDSATDDEVYDLARERARVADTENKAEFDTTTIEVLGEDLTGGQVLKGESGGSTVVIDVAESDAHPGMMAVETEHGFLYLDPEEEYSVFDAEPPSSSGESRAVDAASLGSGQVIVGDSGGSALVYGVSESSAQPGFLSVETEHGFLYLDPEEQRSVRD